MTEELIAPPELTPGEVAVAVANTDLDIARKRAILEQLTAESHRFRGRLQEAGWSIRLSDLELTAPDGRIQCQVQYVGGEFVAYVSGLPGDDLDGRYGFRITPALKQRQPGCFDALAEILLWIAAGGDFALYQIARVPLGLEALGDEPILFGERTGNDDPADDDPRDPANRPDMSGPGNPSGEGR